MTIASLARWPIITYPRNTRPYSEIQELFARADVPAPRLYGNSSLSTIVRMTLDGIGVSAIPPVVIGRELAEKKLRLVRAERSLPDLNFTAAYPVKPDSYIAAAVAELAREIASAKAGPATAERPRKGAG